MKITQKIDILVLYYYSKINKYSRINNTIKSKKNEKGNKKG